MCEPAAPKTADELPTRRRFVVRASSATAALQLGLRWKAMATQARLTATDGLVSSTGSRETDLVLNVNGVDRSLRVEPRVTLLDALRDRLGLTGTKKGCDQGTCGACTVLVNGRRIDSCLTLAMMHAEDRITTVEGISANGKLHPIQAAMIKHDGFQCGFCTPGQVVSAVALLDEGHSLDRETVRQEMSGNICRCGCYPHIVDAILEVDGAS
jgi:xanthine dehydrogenase YagT iron-sulfur-binding subunit